jgi:PBP1b-binding outer membrane lipoprotein LpoB
MKRLILILIGALLLGGCISSKGYLNRGRYDDAVRKAAHKLTKNADKVKEIPVLTQAYKLANDQDLERIAYLKKSGQPDIWDEVFDRYSRLKSRQDVVKSLPGSILSQVNFVPANYDNDIIEAKKKAAEYFYAHAVTLLAKKDRIAAREAYDELMKVKEYYSNYRSTDDLINEARIAGTSNVLFKMNNLAPVVLPSGFESELLKISLEDMDSKWTHFDVREVDGRTYDYYVVLNIKVIDVSPERIKESNWVEFRQVEDGWQYQLDSHGNVMKDTAGNDIKIPRFKTISCQVLQTEMNKQAVVSGVVDFVDNSSNQLLKSEPITANGNFNHIFLTARGDINALKNETRNRLAEPVPFPPDLDMIMMANDYMKDAAKSLIRSNRSLFR